MPVGWQFSVLRPIDTVTPQTWRPDYAGPTGLPERGVQASLIASWQSRVEGLGWLERLVAQGRAFKFAECAGYPFTYLACALDVVPVVGDPPAANAVWVMGDGDVVDPGWGRGSYDAEAAVACAPGEWLVIAVWDES